MNNFGGRISLRLFSLCVFLACVTIGRVATAAQLTLSWVDAASNEDGFKIERKTGTTGTYAQIAISAVNTTTYLDSTLSNSATYCYRVRAYNSIGDSAYSNEACGTTAAPDLQLPTVSLTAPVNGVTVSGTAVTVSANATDNVGVVGVQFKLNGTNLGSEDSTVPYSIAWNTTTVPNDTYTLTAVARDAAGNSTTSTAVTVTVSNTPPPPVTGGLVAAYALNENSGTSTADASGQSNTGTLSGATWTTAGKYAAALSFNGADNFVSIPDAAVLDLGATGSMEAWVKLNSLGKWHGIIAKGAVNNDNAHNYALEVTDTNIARCIIGNGSTNLKIDSTTALVAGQFYHLACTWNGTTAALYINGTLNRSAAQTLTPAGNTAPLFLGQFGGNSDRLDGIIDNVRLYNRALTATEVQTNMNTAVGTTTPPPPTTYTLTVTKSGTGSGTVTSSPTGISCGSDCSEAYAANTPVILTATAAAGSTFTGWSGSCTGTGTCSVTMSAARSVTATFTLAPPTTYSLTVLKSGTGSGTVSSSPAGISCGSDCSEAYAANTIVALTATPTTGSAFAGWSGDADCTDGSVTMTAAKTCTATFSLTPTTYSLIVLKIGNGSGTVMSNPAGISCGSDCVETYAANTSVVLTAAPAAGSTFSGWSGSCTGTGPCSVTMSAEKSVTATFSTGLVAAYNFDAGSGTTASDVSGNNNTGTLTGGVAWTATGKYNKGLSFDGVDDYVSVADSASLDLGSQGTVSAWVKLGTTNTWRSIVAKGSSNKNAAHNYFVELRKDNYIFAGVGNGRAANTVISPSVLTDTAAYHHLAFTWTGSSLNLYLDGVLVRTESQTITPTANTAPLFIGQFGGNTDRFKGLIDEVRVYNRALTLSEIQAVMATPVVTATAAAQLEATASMLNVEIGVYRPSTGKVLWDANGNGLFDGCQLDSCTTSTQPQDNKVGVEQTLRTLKGTENSFGLSGDLKVTGDWLGTGRAELGSFDPSSGMWELDLNGNKEFDGCQIDACLGPFGQKGDLPVVRVK